MSTRNKGKQVEKPEEKEHWTADPSDTLPEVVELMMTDSQSDAPDSTRYSKQMRDSRALCGVEEVYAAHHTASRNPDTYCETFCKCFAFVLTLLPRD
jgi:hypothetical protein